MNAAPKVDRAVAVADGERRLFIAAYTGIHGHKPSELQLAKFVEDVRSGKEKLEAVAATATAPATVRKPTTERSVIANIVRGANNLRTGKGVLR